MEKIPTAKEFLWNGGIITQGDTEPYGKLPNDKVPLVMIEFAKLHVEAALKEASENVKAHRDSNGEWVSSNVKCYLNKDSILNSYPLDKIK